MLQEITVGLEREIERHCRVHGFSGTFEQAKTIWLEEQFPAWRLWEWDRALREADRARYGD